MLRSYKYCHSFISSGGSEWGSYRSNEPVQSRTFFAPPGHRLDNVVSVPGMWQAYLKAVRHPQLPKFCSAAFTSSGT